LANFGARVIATHFRRAAPAPAAIDAALCRSLQPRAGIAARRAMTRLSFAQFAANAFRLLVSRARYSFTMQNAHREALAWANAAGVK
jgi:hypothetical protein